MTVKELASKMNELMRDGYSDAPVFMTIDKQLSTPVKEIYTDKIQNMSIPLVIISSA